MPPKSLRKHVISLRYHTFNGREILYDFLAIFFNPPSSPCVGEVVGCFSQVLSGGLGRLLVVMSGSRRKVEPWIKEMVSLDVFENKTQLLFQKNPKVYDIHQPYR